MDELTYKRSAAESRFSVCEIFTMDKAHGNLTFCYLLLNLLACSRIIFLHLFLYTQTTACEGVGFKFSYNLKL